jgi:hypothetical protein
MRYRMMLNQVMICSLLIQVTFLNSLFQIVRLITHGSLKFGGVSEIVGGSRAPRRCTMAETLTIRRERVDDMP